MTHPSSAQRWEFGLLLTAIAVGASIMGLAWVATSAWQQRHALFVEGQQLRLAHRIERSFRESGPRNAERLLVDLLEESGADVRGFILQRADGSEQLRVGHIEDEPTREVHLFVGASWAFEADSGSAAAPGHGRGRRLLQIYGTPGVERLPPAERMLFPAAIVSALCLVSLAILGGRLLRRQALQAGREATRRRLEGLGRAGAGLAHQLRTPLATIKGRLQLELEKECSAGSRQLQIALQESTRMEELLNQLMDYARPPEPQPRQLQLGQFKSELEARDPRVCWQLPPEVEVHADADHVREMLANLIDNGLRVDQAGGDVTVTSEREGGLVTLSVADRGPGPGEDPEHFFEPYVTGRPDGTGLGLPITRALAEVNGGSVELHARPGGGAIAVLSLPTSAEQS